MKAVTLTALSSSRWLLYHLLCDPNKTQPVFLRKKQKNPFLIIELINQNGTLACPSSRGQHSMRR